jgi:hypothetical protein
LTRDQCILHLDYIKNVSQEVDFDTLIDKTKSIHVILLNKDEWESSICSCVWWHKNNKCNHTIALACRTKLASFDEIAFTIPLNKKRKPGRPARTNCLLRDKEEQEEFVGVDFDMGEPFDLDMVEPNPPIKSKRGRKKKDDTPVITQGNPNDSEVEDRYPKR